MSTAIVAHQEDFFPDLEEPTPKGPRNGVLSSQYLEAMIKNENIRSSAPFDADQIQPASLDLRLGPVAFRVQASFLPGVQGSIDAQVKRIGTVMLDLTRPCVLERHCVYIIPLLEEVRLPATIWGKANPKSSTGRLDVFTRLLADSTKRFDWIPKGYRGRLYVEVVPRAFPVVVREGTRLNQLRLVRGQPSSNDKRLHELHAADPLVFDANGRPTQPHFRDGLQVGVDLVGVHGNGLVGYRARPNTPVLDMSRIGEYEIDEFWEPIPANPRGSLVLNPGDFYILVSRERVRIPDEYAADMVPFDAAVGEFRVHYAGFFDPGFGNSAAPSRGTPAVLEVRSYEVPFLLEDGQFVATLQFENLVAPPTKLYGRNIGSSYQGQGLALAKQFRKPSG